MMIDKHHKGKGYGRKAVRKVIEMAKAKSYTTLIADYVKGNEVMVKLLQS